MELSDMLIFGKKNVKSQAYDVPLKSSWKCLLLKVAVVGVLGHKPAHNALQSSSLHFHKRITQIGKRGEKCKHDLSETAPLGSGTTLRGG